MSETNLSSIEPQVDIVPNEDAQVQPEENQQPSEDERVSEALGIKITGISPSSTEQQETAEPQGETAEANADQSQQPPQDEEEIDDSNFLGKPDENGNYTLTPKSVEHLRNRLYETMQAVSAREAQQNEQIANYRRQIEAYNRQRQQAAVQNQTPQTPSEPKVSKWDEAKAKFANDLAAIMGEEDAKRYADAQFGAFAEAIDERQKQGFDQIRPLLNKVQDQVYREEVLNTVDAWSNDIAQDLANFNVPPEAAVPEVRTFVANFIRGFAENAGRRPTVQEIDEGLARASSKLMTTTLTNRMQENIRQRQLAQQAQASQPAVTPQATAQRPLASPQAQPRVAAKRVSEPSTSVARKMVTAGENLRMAKDAGLMGTPSGGANSGNPDDERMAQVLSQQNGGRSFIKF